MAVNSIICGNNAQVLAGFPADYIDLTVTSPPYDNLRDYNGYEFDFEAVAQQLYRVTKPGGVVVWVVGDATINGSETGTSFRQALRFMEIGFNLHDTMIYHWHKPPLTHNRYEQCFEYMFIFSIDAPKSFNPIKEPTVHAGKVFSMKATAKGFSQGASMRKYKNGRNPIVCGNEKIKQNIWTFKAGRTVSDNEKFIFNHPAIFPEALARDHIISWSNPGDLILDPFCGSGTTLKMAKQLGRHYIGIDISPEYCALSQRRVEGAKVPLFVMQPETNGKPKPEQLELIA